MTAGRAAFYDAFDWPGPARTPVPAASVSSDATGIGAYLEAVCRSVAAAPNGQRNDLLNAGAYSLGRIVAGGQLDEETVTGELTVAAESAGLTPAEISATIKSGLKAGAADPRQLDAAGVPEVTVIGQANSQPVVEVWQRRARVTWASDIRMSPPVWAWIDDGQGRIPAGSLSVAAGREGTGKSTFGMWLAAQITKGTLPGSFYGTPRHVLYAAVEDSWEHTLAPRLAAAGADLSRVGRFDVVENDDDQVTLCLPYDNRLLEQAIVEHSIALVVMDPLMSMLSEKIDTHTNRSVRQALDPLAQLADRTRCLLMGIAHFNKGAGTDPSSLITGSGAFKDVPRSIFGFVRDSDAGDGTRVMTQTKNALGRDRDDLPSLKYVIEDAVVDTPDGPAHVGRLSWKGTSDRSAGEILRDAGTSPEDRNERDDAATWLREYLGGKPNGEAAANDVRDDGRDAGFSLDTLKRAKSKANVRSRKAGLTDGWVWALDSSTCEGSTEGSEESTDTEPAPFAPFPLPSGPAATNGHPHEVTSRGVVCELTSA